jgi:DNA-binding CsgD family transcriptional regulator
MGKKPKVKLAVSKTQKARNPPQGQPLGKGGDQVETTEARDKSSRLLERTKKKYPDIEPNLLKSYLSQPVDEQPLWFNSGMSEGERQKVIEDFHIFARNAKMVPPLRIAGSQADRAVKRQTRLTFKQWQVGRLTVQGLDIKEIAAQLKISDRMVKTQLQAIRRKGSLSRNAQIVLWFLGC